MKKLTGIAATVLAAGMAVTLAGCGGCGGCSGCNSKTVNNALTNSNWFTGTGFKGIQPFFIVDENHPEYTKEIITYDVTFDNSKAYNKSYSLDYKDGKFTTGFYATEYDWNASSVPEKYRAEKTEILYCYKTQLSISVQYKKGDNATEWFNDSVTTECYFRAAAYSLQPVYSRREVVSTSPKNYTADKLENAYEKLNCIYENYYNYNFTEVTSYCTEEGKEQTEKVFGKLNKRDNTVFDNASLYIAVRSMKLSSSFSQYIDLFSDVSGGVSTCRVYGSEDGIEEKELSKISEALADAKLYSFPVDDEGNPKKNEGIATVAMKLENAGGDFSGAAHTVWYAAIQNANNNTARTTMLKMSVPISYELGTLNYSLNTVESTIWNG
ncbi:MAG: hypothetical protein K2I30_06005 [Clostridia bacterium]|nr:hypothetical protein [Clostridia bacterium]